MNEPNTIESDETSNNNELRLSSGSSSDSSFLNRVRVLKGRKGNPNLINLYLKNVPIWNLKIKVK